MVTEFRLLGPVEVWAAGQRLDVGRPQQQLVLAILLVTPSQLVPTQTLVDRVWGHALPDTDARRSLSAHISRIRSTLWQADPTGAGAAVPRASGGYQLDTSPERVDLHRFQRLFGEAREPGRPAGERITVLRAALAEWRGTPLAGLSGSWAAGVRDQWLSQRRDALLAWAAAEVDAGDPGAAVPALIELTDEYPLDESVTAALMHALRQSGRTAEALEWYTRARRRLADELGIEPGPELQELHLMIVRGEHRPAPAAPAQLPPGIPGFVGRRSQLTELTELISDTVDKAVVVVSGPGGVGKTALAVHWATTAAAKFPGGVLYVSLRGFHPTLPAMSPAEAIRGFLEAFDVPARQVPVTLSAQISMYRRLAGSRPVLVLLDNARDAEQVRPLLPNAPGALTLVTSRHLLTALVITDGAYPIPLDVLSADESRQLLTARLGAARVEAEPRSVDEIIDRCAGLPLAMTVIATQAAARHRPALADLARKLRAEPEPLDAVSNADPTVDVRTVLSLSYRQLTAEAATLFRLLGLHCSDLTAAAAASLLGVPIRQVAPVLAELTEASLIVERAQGRFDLHDLLRAYAAEQLSAGAAEVRDAALHRVLDFYLHTAYAADGLLYPHRDEISLDPPSPGVVPQAFNDDRQAMAWLAAERAVLLAAVDQAAENDLPAHALRTALVLVTFLDRQGYWHEQVTALHRALEAARRLGDKQAQGHTLRILGLAHARLGRYAEADAHDRQALELFVALGDRSGQARTHRDLANMSWRQGRRADALYHVRQLLQISETAGLRAGSAFTLYAVACAHLLTGEHPQAVATFHQAVAAHREIGDRVGEAAAWEGLGHAHHESGQHRQALICHRSALRLRREIGDRYLEADSLIRVGDTEHAAGRHDAARAAWLSAYQILAELGHPDADRTKARIDSCHTNCCHS